MSRRRGLIALLILFVLLDLLYSASQHYRQPLDGDLARVVLPDAAYLPVLHDPWGLNALLHQQVYAAPNRFFAHATMWAYMREAPLLLQTFVSPISSIYLACALFKTGVQALLIAILAAYATQVGTTFGRRGAGFWIAAAILVPLFQTAGYQTQMGIIDRAITYVFFYAFPLALLLGLFWPFFRAWANARAARFRWPQLIALGALAVYLTFHGPLVAGVVAVVLLVGLISILRTKQLSLPRQAKLWNSQPVIFGALLGVLIVYSLYIGRYNIENLGPEQVSIGERYARLPLGIWAQLKGKLGLPLLVLVVLVNRWLLRRRVAPTITSAKLQTLLGSLAWLTLGYLLLLPLGGYRPYRELILRYDTLLPITLGLMLGYAATTLHLVRELPTRIGNWYKVGLVVFSAIYLFADKPIKAKDTNTYERHALTVLAASTDSVVKLPMTGKVMSWEPIASPQYSQTNAELLYYWGITPEVRLYYQQ